MQSRKQCPTIHLKESVVYGNLRESAALISKAWPVSQLQDLEFIFRIFSRNFPVNDSKRLFP